MGLLLLMAAALGYVSAQIKPIKRCGVCETPYSDDVLTGGRCHCGGHIHE